MIHINNDIAELETSANVQALKLAIVTGEMDAHLDDVFDTVIQRRQILKAQATNLVRAIITVGADITITGNINPKYLNGVHATVVEIRDGHIFVVLGNMKPGPKFRKGMKVGIPASCIKLR